MPLCLDTLVKSSNALIMYTYDIESLNKGVNSADVSESVKDLKNYNSNSLKQDLTWRTSYIKDFLKPFILQTTTDGKKTLMRDPVLVSRFVWTLQLKNINDA